MAIFSTTWDLTPCSEFVLASSVSQQKTASKRSFSPSFGTCTSCDCDLDNQFEIIGRFNPASNDFESTCTNPAHAFALRWSASGGPATKKNEKRSLGGFSPVFKAFTPPPHWSHHLSLRGGGYSSGPESDPEEDEQCSLRGGLDYYSDLGFNVEVGRKLPLRGGEGLVDYDSDWEPDDEEEQWIVVEEFPRKPAQEAKKDLKKVWNEAKASTSKTKDNWRILSTKTDAPVKKDVTKIKTAWQQMRPACREEARAKKETVKAKSNALTITSIDDSAPLSWRAKAAVAVEKVEKVNAALEASKPTQALKLTPASVVHKSIETSSKQTVSLDLDLANLPHQSKKIQIATKLINTLDIQCASAQEIILKGVTQMRDNYSKAGIHIFIDASNIQLGFQDALKRNVGLADDDYVSSTPSIIFECFSFILERGRPVRKREIVGSSINGVRPEYFDDAERCGYRATAPEKVKKFRTKRKWVDGRKVEVEREAYFEQLVDEYIHRLMSDSVLDAVVHNEEPGTMVLATGDANGAEYDDNGFLQYVERALKLGWKVEVVAWKPSMSNNWKKLKESSKFRDNLTIITLDEFREDLTRGKTPADKAGDCWWWRET